MVGTTGTSIEGVEEGDIVLGDFGKSGLQIDLFDRNTVFVYEQQKLNRCARAWREFPE